MAKISSLGLDTSNYTTSVSLLCGDEIIEDRRILLKVKPGERGLRQSDALFQHWNNLPGLLEPVLRKHKDEIERICVSTRPRPVEGSYMPVFNAGAAVGKMLSDALGVPLIECSHQEGHILAAALGNDVDFEEPVLCAHLSGGTLEIVRYEKGTIELISGTLDISFGQLIDRTGVAMGYGFPAGKEIDRLAMEQMDVLGGIAVKHKNPICKACLKDGKVNLSGVEAQISQNLDKYTQQEIAFFLMERISQSIVSMMEDAKEKSGINQVLISGGVASSSFLRKFCEDYGYIFGQPRLCSDNAVGVARYNK